MFDRRLIFYFDWVIFLTSLCIATIGVITIYSAIHVNETLITLYIKQIYWIIYGLFAMFIILFIDYHLLAKWIYVLYYITILLLIFVLMFGKVISGAQRWLSFGAITFQISELAKIIIIVLLAKYFDESKVTGLHKLKNLIIPFIFVAIPFILIAKQPDLGTSMVLFFTFVLTILIIGINRRSLIWLACMATISLPFAWFCLKDYQKKRVLILINPNLDPLGMGYHTMQSKIAIGSGGLLGKGLFAGTQSRLNFLPERHTDFIFSILAEETGFIGSIVLIILYFILILKGISIIHRCKDKLGLTIAVGIVCMLSISILINIGMTVGLFPIVGIPLPLMSYGGSSTITTFIALGILMNIGMRKFKYE